MRTTHNNRWFARQACRAAIDALEPRRMLATFSGTNLDDTIDITTSGALHRVQISTHGGPPTVHFTPDLTITLNALGDNDVISVADTLTGSNIVVNAGTGSDRISIADASAPVTVHTGSGDADALIVNSDFGAGDAPVTVVIDQTDDVEALDVRQGGTVRVQTGAVLVKTRTGAFPENLTLTGVLDLAGGAFLSRAGGQTPAQFQTFLTRGYNNGAWNGTHASGAINSSLAASSPISDGVGYGLGSQIAPTTIGNFTIAPGDTLLRYALDGDADLNQQVNLGDFNRIAANFGLPGRAWVHGDFNYDDAVNLTDFNKLVGTFGQALAPEAFGNSPIRIAGNHAELGKLPEELT